MLLGKWCLNNDIERKNNSTYNFVNHPLSNYKEREKHYRLIQEKVNCFSLKIGKTLNNYHNMVIADKSWKMLLGNYILTLSHIIYIKWHLIQNALNDNNLSSIRIPEFDGQDTFIPSNMMQYFNQFQDETFLAYLTSKILLKIDNKIPIENYNLNTTIKNDINNNIISRFIVFFNSVVWKIFSVIGKSPKTFFFKTSLNKKSEISYNINLGQIPFVHPFEEIKTFHAPIMKLRSKMKSNNLIGFDKVLYELLWDYLPVSFLEGFKNQYEKIQKMTKNFHPRTIVTSMAGTMGNEAFIIYLMTRGNKRPKIISLQHGGCYGTFKFNSVEEHEIDVSDYYFSWGWSNNIKVIPSYVHKHLGNSFKKNKLGSNLVFINYSWTKHDYRISPTIMSTEMEGYIESQKIFFQNIKNNVKKKLRIRFYVEDYGWGIKEKLIDYIDDSNISKISYMKDLKRARIVVPTYNSTTILETLAFDIPTVAFFDPNVEKFNENATPFFNKLNDVGILHYDPLSAAKFINSIWDDVETWWKSDDVQKAKKTFVQNFANLPKKSEEIFIKQIKKIEK